MNANPETLAVRSAWAPANPALFGVIWLAIVLAGLLAFYWSGLVWMFDAWSRPEYSHGYLIPPIALYLFLSQLRREADDRGADAPKGRLGVAVVLFGLLIGLLGNLSNAPGITAYGCFAAVAGLVLVVMGTRRGLRQWPALAYLLFALPLPTSLYWSVSIEAQWISSVVGVGIISLLGVPVFLDGNVIDLGNYQLQVAEACSGLRYLFPLLSFGFLFAALYKGPSWHKVVLFVSALPIAVLMNCIRVAIIGFLVDRYGIEQAEGFLHLFEGWVIFAACVVMLYGEAVLLQRFVSHRRPVHSMLEVDLGAIAGQACRVRDIRPGGALLTATGAVVVAALGWYLTPASSASVPDRSPLVLFPLEIGQWHGRLGLLDPSIEAVLAADDYLNADFTLPGSDASINLFVAYYKSQAQGSGIHSPEVCLPAGGWEVSGWSTVDLPIKTASNRPLPVNRAIIQKGTSRQLVYYWFEQRGRVMTNDYVAKAYTILDAITQGRTDGALVRVITPIAPTGSIAEADDRLQRFLELALPELPRYVPE